MLISHLLRSRIKIARAHAFERLGSQRYSFPGLNNLDVLVAPYLTGLSEKSFLEIGAFDGYSKSNTYHLERFEGWTGILIEPLPAMFDLCRKHRRASSCFDVACVAPGGPSEVALVNRGLMSVAPDLVPEGERERRVGLASDSVNARAKTLSAVIDESPFERVSFMSVDVEGAELEVLAGLDLSRHCPDVLLVETDRPEEIDGILAGAMDRSAQLSFHDYVYVNSASMT